MPLYEYECQKCHKRLETLQRVSEPALTTCPECAGVLRKLISAPAFHLKGEGWYVTDYGRKPDGGAKVGEGAAGGAEKPAKEDKAGSAKEGKSAAGDSSGKAKKGSSSAAGAGEG
ncbi:MAG TPA: zinc ribbon domain-containing protein [Thermoanaerobaculia bacterium]|nr:zinc ribbon domain-containing protein [Thermoanaerobaculia bacterium]